MNKQKKLKKAEKKAKILKSKLTKAEKALVKVEKIYTRDVKKLLSKIEKLRAPQLNEKKVDAAVSEDLLHVGENGLLTAEPELTTENI